MVEDQTPCFLGCADPNFDGELDDNCAVLTSCTTTPQLGIEGTEVRHSHWLFDGDFNNLVYSLVNCLHDLLQVKRDRSTSPCLQTAFRRS